jgi:hypothetical protein
VPIFSEGLRRLYDGLILFRDDPATPDVQEVDDAVRRLDRYLASASLQHTYTTYYGRSPSEPSVKPVLESLEGGIELLAGPVVAA